ncbi:MAG: asparaginase [Halieaceae bacterium]|jgi:L-asparaginase type II|nr:asparaginase [Halieaceae bacterium]
MKLQLALILMFASTLSHAERAVPPAEVLVLTTGGTIASRRDAPMVDGPELVQAVPELLEHATIRVEEFSVVGSSKMTPANWLALAKSVNAHFARNTELAGIVITHGTDTLEETAYFLNLTVKADRPVVIVGSMRSSDEVSADGPGNLINAVRVAVSAEAAGQGVLVTLNEDIYSARDVWKTDNRRVHTFEASIGGPVGSVDPDGVRFHARSLHPHTTQSEFDIATVDQLPEVMILSDFTGIDPAVVERFARQPMDGLVVRSFAGARTSAGMAQGLKAVAELGLPTVVTSRVPRGRVVSPPTYPFPAIAATEQQDNKARILLMLALTRSSEVEEIRRIFSSY